jgi:hypothetical protein
LQLQSSPKIGKSTLRRFFDSNSEKIRGRLASGAKKDGYGLGGLGLAGALMEEKIIVKRWEGGGRRGELWDNGLKGKKVFTPSLFVTLDRALALSDLW